MQAISLEQLKKLTDIMQGQVVLNEPGVQHYLGDIFVYDGELYAETYTDKILPIFDRITYVWCNDAGWLKSNTR